MFNSREAYYKTPFGAVAAGTAVRLCVRLPKSDVRIPTLEVYLPGEKSPFLRQELGRESGAEGFWDYRTEYTPDAPGLYFYRFLLWDGVGEKMPLCRLADGSAGWGEGELWQLTVYEASFTTPQRFRGRVMMQIFPDRFCNSGLPKENVPPGRRLHHGWEERPQSVPDADGVFRCGDYFGGDLAGITEKLDYIKSMGVGALYLNPIFEAHSNHRYNTADYLKIDPLLGNEQDFITLCEEAHKRDILIILDGVFNHTGSDSLYFNREGRYGAGGAYRDPGSPYHDWYCWKNFERHEYESWWGFLTLPNVNEQSESYREFICGENGVLRHWLRLGADGWRLDVVDELPDFFVREIRAAVKAEKPEALLMGEVWEDASRKQSYGEQRMYLMGRELDSVMNYPLRTAILGYLRGGDGAGFCHSLFALLENYPACVTGVLMNCLSSHDVPRAITALGGLPMEHHDRDWQRAHNTLSVEQYYRGRQLFMLGMLLYFALPGCPCIYYGDEAGLSGYADPFNRSTYPWGHEDIGLRECIRQIALLRCGHPALSGGEVRPLRCEGDFVSLLRCEGQETLIIAVNRGNAPAPLPAEALGEVLYTIGHCREGLLGAESAAVIAGLGNSDTKEKNDETK